MNRAWPGWGIAVLVAVGAGACVVRPRRVAVVGSSMEPTLTSGDRLLVVRRSVPRIGDIVAVRDPGGAGRLLVKRVVSVVGGEIGVEGDNPRGSTDSRHFGPVGRQAVVGRAVYRYGPPRRSGALR